MASKSEEMGFDSLRVNVGSPTAFWVKSLALELHRLGLLQQFHTLLPHSRTAPLPREHVTSRPWLLAPFAVARLLQSGAAKEKFERLARVAFNTSYAASVTECDVCHSISGFGVAAQRIARDRYGAIGICDRGSTHIKHQEEMLRAECDKWGVSFRPTASDFIEAELQHYEQADLITVPSRVARDTFVANGVPDSKIAVAPFGVDLQHFLPHEKNDDVFRILFVGTLSLRKGIPYLIEAMSKLTLPNAELVLVGPVCDEIRKFLKPRSLRIRCLGGMSRQELPFIYSQASVFVLPSIEEGLAMVQAEALACGVPVIASTATGAADLFQDGLHGFIVLPRDSDAIAARMEMLYCDPQRRDAMGRAAREHVQTLGGWRSYGDCVQESYRVAKAGNHTDGAVA